MQTDSCGLYNNPVIKCFTKICVNKMNPFRTVAMSPLVQNSDMAETHSL